MTNKFWQETKEILSEFIYETKGYAAWVAKEVKRQYHLAILKEIALTYPETTLNVNKAYEIIEGVLLDCPDFVESPEESPDNVEFWSRADDSAFETKEEAVAFKFAEKMQELRKNAESLVYTDTDDELNEPAYPYDTEPSA